MKQYEAYKDSGIQWQEKIPTHWSTTQMKRLFSFGKGLSITKADLVEEGRPVISYGQVHAKNNPGTRVEDHLLRFVPEAIAENDPSSAVSEGDFIFADTSEDLTGCGNCAYIDRSGIYAGYHSVIAKSDRKNNKYFAYLFLTDAWRSQLRSSVGGVKVFSITQSILGQTTVIIPSEAEQEVIAAYLDQKVGKIDAIIAEKEAMVEQLQQYRKSLISETVTRGLDPNVPMKDSGIDKFPDVNEKWNTTKLKYIASIKSGTNVVSSSLLGKGPYEVLGGNGFMGYYSSFNVNAPAIIIGRVGALCGNIHLIKSPSWITDNALILSINDDCSYEFLSYYLDAYDLNTLNSSNAQPLITGTKVLEIIVPLPSSAEQQDIADFLNCKCEKIDKSIEIINRQIEDLRAYKSSVITEAVTGKVDLRDWKPSEANA